MTLDEYLKANSLTDKEFGERIGRSQSSVTRLRNGTTLPDWTTVARIAEATGNVVTANDFMPASPEAAE